MTAQRLFTGPRLSELLNSTTKKLLKAAANLPARAFDSAPDGTPADPAAALVARANMTVPVFDWEATRSSTVEASVVERTSNPRPSERAVTASPGIRVIVTVPFTGTAGLLTRCPARHYLGGFDTRVYLHGHTISIDTTSRHLTTEEVQAHVAAVRTSLDTYLAGIAAETDRWQADLTAAVRSEVNTRATFLTELGTLTGTVDRSELVRAVGGGLTP